MVKRDGKRLERYETYDLIGNIQWRRIISEAIVILIMELLSKGWTRRDLMKLLHFIYGCK
jgi:hypothetical protein